MSKTKIIAATFLLAGAVFAQSALAQTTTTTTHTRMAEFNPTGFATSETMQVNVTNIAVASTATNAVAPSCTGSVSFYGPAGTLYGTATAFTLASGVTSSIKLPYSAASAGGARPVVRAVITLTTTTTTGAATPACALISSLETYDTTTGATHVHIDGGAMSGR